MPLNLLATCDDSIGHIFFCITYDLRKHETAKPLATIFSHRGCQIDYSWVRLPYLGVLAFETNLFLSLGQK